LHFRTVRLAPLRTDDFDPFLTKIGVAGKWRMQLIKTIDESGAVKGLITTPLMLTLAVIVYNAEKSIPPDLPEFFEVLFQTVFSKHDKSKPGFMRPHKTALAERKLQKLFEAFCFMALQKEYIRTLTVEQFNSAFEKALQYSDVTCTADDFRDDIVHVTCLMQEEGFDVTFIHQSIQEYYSAAFIKHCHDEAARRFYERIMEIRSAKYQQVLQFLKQIDLYRWAKYYRVPTIRQVAKKFMPDSEMVSIDAVKNLYQNAASKFVIDAKGEYSLLESGPVQSENGMDQIATQILDVALNVAVAITAKLKQNPTAIIPGMQRTGEQLSIPFSILLTDDHVASFSGVVKKYIEDLSAEEADLEAVIRAEERKAAIF
jgi:hypothetical protein